MGGISGGRSTYRFLPRPRRPSRGTLAVDGHFFGGARQMAAVYQGALREDSPRLTRLDGGIRPATPSARVFTWR